MPLRRAIASAVGTKGAVMMAAAGMPRFSNPMASSTLPDEQDPQSPIAVTTATNAAAVHGFGVAFMWSSIIFAVAIVASLVLINAGKDDIADIEAMPGT